MMPEPVVQGVTMTPEEQSAFAEFKANKDFEALIASEAQKDPNAFGELVKTGIIASVVKDFPEAKGNINLIKKLALNAVKAAEATKGVSSKPEITSGSPTPAPKSGSATPPVEPGRVSDTTGNNPALTEAVDWNNIDMSKLDKVSTANKIALAMVYNPEAYKLKRYR